MKTLIAGNWKMNSSSSIVEAMSDGSLRPSDAAEILICPPFQYLLPLKPICEAAGIALGAQDCSAHDSGAYTGEVSAVMLREAGCSYVILGHSERRAMHDETDDLVRAKAERAVSAGLKPIICVGETQDERDAGLAKQVVERQIAQSLPQGQGEVVVAYEPVWAIGTGKTASADDAQDMHAFIRGLVPAGTRILYGGSMKPDNAKGLLSMPDIDGGLIGGASLKADAFTALARAAV